MKNTNLFKKAVATVGAICFCAALAVASPVASIKVQAATAPTVQPQEQIISWVFKKKDGKLYKCKYNYTTGEYIGDWIFVRYL